MISNTLKLDVQFPRMYIPQFDLLQRLLTRSRCYFHTECKRVSSTTLTRDSKRSTITASELNKFAKQAVIWWTRRSCLQNLNVCRIPFICEGILSSVNSIKALNSTKPLTGFRILDVGCGGGFLTEPLARLGASVTGLDPATELIQIATEHALLDSEIASNLTYVCDTIESYKNKVEPFDAVVCSEVIEHVDNVPYFIQCCAKLVKKNGSIFFTTINRTFWSYMLAILLCEYIVGTIPKGTHHWNMFVKPEYLQKCLSYYNFQTVSQKGIVINPFTRQWFWSSSDSCWFAFHAVKEDKEIIDMKHKESVTIKH